MAFAASDLVFSEQANHNFSRILGELKRSNLSIANRLRSVQDDAEFVRETAAAFQRPLVANERCGSWYIHPRDKVASAYFKSTDGHAGQWKFSTRRLNLHLLPLIGENDGCIIVDSTRRGKRIPDALSKTIPIWCCVLNRALFPELAESNQQEHEIHVPPQAVSASEHSQMQARIADFVSSLQRLGLDLASLRRQLRKPLRPIWVNRPEDGGGMGGFESETPPSFPPSASGDGDGDSDGDSVAKKPSVFENSHPVICCTSSRRVGGGGGAETSELSESGYIQGAGDDTENWAHGLTPPVFWAHADLLLSTPEAELPDLIRSLVSEAESSRRRAATAAGSGGIVAKELFAATHGCAFSISVGVLPADGSPEPSEPGQVILALSPELTKPEEWKKTSTTLEMGLGKSKIASRSLRLALPVICDFIQEQLRLEPQPNTGDNSGEGWSRQRPIKVLIACETGKDVSVGVALALACRFLDQQDDGDRAGPVTKDSIRVKLGRIMTTMPDANPSRATLQSVNSFLMDWHS